MSLKEEIGKAIGAHGMWKTHLSSAIETGKSDFTAEKVALDNQCDFGKFIYGPSIDSAHKTADFESCRRLHADFHAAAASVLRHALAGNKTLAKSEMAGDSKFSEVSGKLTMAMMQWSSHLK